MVSFVWVRQVRHVSFRLGMLGCVGVVRGKFGQGRRGELGSVGLWYCWVRQAR